jgi:hypothetical protein
MRKVWLLSFLLAVRAASAQGSDPVKSLAGCYELRLLPSDTSPYSPKPLRLPRKFSLTVQHNHPDFLANNLDTKVEWDLPFSSWTAKDVNTLDILWSTGFVGYRVHLKRSAKEFLGKADYFDDTGDDASQDIVATVVQCKPQKKN